MTQMCKLRCWLLLAFATAYALRETDLIDRSAPATEVTLSPEDFVSAHTEPEPDISAFVGDGDPITKARKFEGDIAGVNATGIKKFIQDSNYLGRNAIRNRYQRWPDGIIPYTLSSQYGPISRRTIARAMEEFHKRTCVRFKPRSDERHYIYIHPDDGCYSLVGRVGGRQPLSLDSGCIAKGTIMHELMHSTGFFHEQSRSDRDDYIEIIDRNLITGAEDQFQKYSLREITHLGTTYDYGSIMHYSQYAFSKNGRITIRAKQSSGQSKMGNRRDFSKNDLYKINKLYSCEDKLDSSDIDDDGNTGGRTDGVDDCDDDQWNCRIQKFLGYCAYDRDTKENCKKTCGLCDETEEGPARPAPTPRPTPRRPSVPDSGGDSDCRNKKSKCQDWSEKEYCTKYPKYMRANCPQACGLCERGSGSGSERRRPTTTTWRPLPADRSTEVSCKNKNHHCEDWASGGRNFCTQFPAYMERNCAKACGLCGRERDPEARSAQSGGECRDNHRRCAEYKSAGYCDREHSQFSMMEHYCKSSCELC